METSNVTRIGPNVTFTIDELRPRIITLLTDIGVVVHDGKFYRFKSTAVIPGFDSSALYMSREDVVDALIRAWYPDKVRSAA